MENKITDQVLSIRLIGILSQPFIKKNISIPSWLLILLTETLAVLLHVGFAFLIYGNSSFALSSLLWASWGALMAGFIVILVERNINMFLQATEKMIDFYNPAQTSFAKWKKDTFQLQKQIWFSIIFATAIFPTTYIFFKLTMGDFINIGALILYLNLI